MESNIETEQHAATSEVLDSLMAELDEYPEARIELAFEIAAEHRRLGQPDQAVSWLREAVAAGGFDGAMAASSWPSSTWTPATTRQPRPS